MYKWLCKNGFIKIRDTKEKQKKKSDREEKIKKENISEGKRKIWANFQLYYRGSWKRKMSTYTVWQNFVKDLVAIVAGLVALVLAVIKKKTEK